MGKLSVAPYGRNPALDAVRPDEGGKHVRSCLSGGCQKRYETAREGAGREEKNETVKETATVSERTQDWNERVSRVVVLCCAGAGCVVLCRVVVLTRPSP